MTDGAAAERLAILVHEVRSPTAALVAIAKTLRDGVDEPARRELVRLALAACDAIDRIVLDASIASIRSDSVDVAELVRAVVATAVLDGSSVRAEVSSELPPIRGDALRLRQALLNLVINAHVHSGTKDEIVVGASASRDEVRLFVSDAGEGVPPADQARILEPGVRLHTSRPGSGLGLAIVRAIAEAHHGRLDVESSPGRGATFALVLPVG